MNAALPRFLDVREGEAPLVLRAFATLFLIVAAQTTMETARDAMFLTRLSPTRLNVVYVVVAGLTLVATDAHQRLAARFGRQRTLVATLLAAACVAFGFAFLTPSPRLALALYVAS